MGAVDKNFGAAEAKIIREDEGIRLYMRPKMALNTTIRSHSKHIEAWKRKRRTGRGYGPGRLQSGATAL